MYSKRIYKTALSITRNPHDAEEALQDTFLRAYVAIKKFEGKSKFYTWLTRIAVNSALAIVRKQRARSEVLFDPHPDNRYDAVAFEIKDSGPTPEELCLVRQRRQRTLRAIRRLRPHLRAPIRMLTMHGWSVSEISLALSISESAVKSRLYRARKQLSTWRGDGGIAPSSIRLTNPTRIDR